MSLSAGHTWCDNLTMPEWSVASRAKQYNAVMLASEMLQPPSFHFIDRRHHNRIARCDDYLDFSQNRWFLVYNSNQPSSVFLEHIFCVCLARFDDFSLTLVTGGVCNTMHLFRQTAYFADDEWNSLGRKRANEAYQSPKVSRTISARFEKYRVFCFDLRHIYMITYYPPQVSEVSCRRRHFYSWRGEAEFYMAGAWLPRPVRIMASKCRYHRPW